MSGPRVDYHQVPEPYGKAAAALAERGAPAAAFADLLFQHEASASANAKVAMCLALRLGWGNHPLIVEATAMLLSPDVEPYHAQMLRDSARNEGYAQAIAENVKPGMIVLDIGTGSGYLSILAAKAGATHVYAIERRPIMASIARANAARNGVADKITVIDGLSFDVKVGEDLPKKADLLVHEVFGAQLLCEGVFRILAHAREQLLEPGAPLLPDRARIFARLDGIAYEMPVLDAVCGVDLSILSLLDHGLAMLGADSPVTPLSDGACLAEFDLTAQNPIAGSPYRTPMSITADGTAQSVQQWLGYSFPGGNTFENPPGTQSHWATMRRNLTAPAPVRAGQSIDLTTHVRDDFIWYDLDQGAPQMPAN